MDDRTRIGKDHWDSQARDKLLDADLVTHRDRYQRRLEIALLLQYLPHDLRVLDVGCGNGYSTALMAEVSAEVVGVDCSESMIQRAAAEFGGRGNLTFRLMEAQDLRFPDGSFDLVVTQRCLINLTSWAAQQAALLEIERVLSAGGTFLMQEGSKQGRRRLNEVREMFCLDSMPDVEFNLDLDEDVLWPFLRRSFDVVDVRRLGAYDLISRVVHPLLVAPDEPSYLAKINEIACLVGSKLSVADDLSREFTAILRRLS